MSELELDNTTRRKKEVLKEACRAIAKSVMTSAEKKMEAERMAEEKRLNMEKLAWLEMARHRITGAEPRHWH